MRPQKRVSISSTSCEVEGTQGQVSGSSLSGRQTLAITRNSGSFLLWVKKGRQNNNDSPSQKVWGNTEEHWTLPLPWTDWVYLGNSFLWRKKKRKNKASGAPPVGNMNREMETTLAVVGKAEMWSFHGSLQPEWDQNLKGLSEEGRASTPVWVS